MPHALTPAYWLLLLQLAGTAVVFADVLVREGMLLAPVQRWLREWHLTLFIRKHTRNWQQTYTSSLTAVQGATSAYIDGGYELDNQWWAKMLWFCSTCTAGQWGFWGYLVCYHYGYSWQSIPEHLAFTAFTILAALLFQKWIRQN